MERCTHDDGCIQGWPNSAEDSHTSLQVLNFVVEFSHREKIFLTLLLQTFCLPTDFLDFSIHLRQFTFLECSQSFLLR